MADVDNEPGQLWALIQQWMDSMPYPPSQNRLAMRIKVSSSALNDWKYGRGFPKPHNIERLAEEIGVSKDRVLDAVLIDRGYREHKPRSAAG